MFVSEGPELPSGLEVLGVMGQSGVPYIAQALDLGNPPACLLQSQQEHGLL